MPDVVDHISDLAEVVDLAGTVFERWGDTFAGQLAEIATLAADADGRLAFLAKDPVFGTRRHFAALQAALSEMAEEVVRDLAGTLNRADITKASTPQRILGIGLREWMIANNKKLASRGVVHNAPSAVTGTGDGVLVVHGLDDQATPEALEAATNGTITFECIADAGMGREAGSELFRVRDQNVARDILELGGFGATQIEATHSGKVSAIANADLGQDFGADADSVNKIPAFTIDSGTPAQLTQDTTNKFRGKNTINSVGNFKIIQPFSGLPINRPSLFSIAYNREIGTGDGTLTIRGGSGSANVSLVAQTGWNRLNLIAWPRRYSGGGNDLEIELSDRTTGSVKFSQGVVAPLARLGGRYSILLAGNTDFAVGDVITQQTVITVRARSIKEWLHRWFGLSFELPHNATPSEGWEDPPDPA